MAITAQSAQGSAYTLTTSSNANFIPELWSAMVQRERDKNLVMARTVKMIDFRGVRGDTMYIPIITGAHVVDKAEETPVSYQSHTDDTYSIQVTKHRVSPFMVEDVVQLQSSVNQLAEYTERHGYQMALDNDLFLLSVRADIAGDAGPGDIFVSDTGLSTGTYEPISEAAILAAKDKLDDARVPEEGRFGVVSARQYNSLLAIDAFRNQLYAGGGSLQNGTAPARIHGFNIIKSTALRLNTDTEHKVNSAGNQATGDELSPGYSASSTWWPDQFLSTALVGLGTLNDDGETAIFGHTDWCALAMQRDIRVNQEWDIDYLAYKVVYDYVFGFKSYRADHAVLVHTSA